MSRVAIEPQMIEIPAGSFLMGSESGAADEQPVHEVRIDSFQLGKFTITNREFDVFAKQTSYPCLPFANDPDFNHPEQPAVGASWHDAISYCNWLSVVNGMTYRLPTEAEWEYAACSGSSCNVYPWGDRGWAELPELHSSFDRGPCKVGSFPTGAWGMFELGMNVHEWCSDWYDAGYYAVSPARNPKGPLEGSRRASRGGSWRHMIKVTRCAARSSIPPTLRYADYGFRIIRS